MMCCFDLVANNTDRKANHVLRGYDGKLWGIDQGLTFHADTKIRTVIWDFGEEQIPERFAGTPAWAMWTIACSHRRGGGTIDAAGRRGSPGADGSGCSGCWRMEVFPGIPGNAPATPGLGESPSPQPFPAREREFLVSLGQQSVVELFEVFDYDVGRRQVQMARGIGERADGVGAGGRRPPRVRWENPRWRRTRAGSSPIRRAALMYMSGAGLPFSISSPPSFTRESIGQADDRQFQLHPLT